VNTRKKGILFFAVVAGIMLTSAVTLAVNPAQWIDDSSDFDEMTQEELMLLIWMPLVWNLDIVVMNYHSFVLQTN